MVRFKSVKRNRKYEDIVGQIQEAILTNDLKSGDKLPSEKELGKIFDVSRSTVRESIRSLEQLGIVEVRQGSLGGSYIKKIDMDAAVEQMANVLRMTDVTFQQLAEARAVLEGSLIRNLQSSPISAEDFDRLAKNIAMAEDYYRSNKNDERLHANFAFHVMIVRLVGNPALSIMHSLITTLSLKFYTSVKSSREMCETSMDYHKAILRLIKDNNFDKASEVCVRHIQDTTASVIEKSHHQSLFVKNL